jgi:hypothetical protein
MAYCLDMQRNTRQRLLDLMIARLGRRELAARLDVPLVVLDDWLAGETPIPNGKLVALIDLIDETGDPNSPAASRQTH